MVVTKIQCYEKLIYHQIAVSAHVKKMWLRKEERHFSSIHNN